MATEPPHRSPVNVPSPSRGADDRVLSSAIARALEEADDRNRSSAPQIQSLAGSPETRDLMRHAHATIIAPHAVCWKSHPIMERAAKAIARLKGAELSPEQIAISAWSTAVGKRLADRTNAKALVRTRLVIEVDDAVWQTQLYQLRHQILPRIAAVIGPGIVDDLEFRIAPAIPRRPPQSAPALASADDADAILDPVMRLVYKQSRKKAIP